MFCGDIVPTLILLCKPPVPRAVGLGAPGGAARSSSCQWWTLHHIQEGVLVPGRTGEDRWAVFLGAKSTLFLNLILLGKETEALPEGASQRRLVAAMDDSGGMLLNGFEMPFNGFACFWQEDHKEI